MGLFARSPSTSAFPRFAAGRLLHHLFRGLHSVHFRYGLQTRQVTNVTLYTRGFSSFVTSTTAPIATGRSEPVPGAGLPPLWTSAFSRRAQKEGKPGDARADIYSLGCVLYEIARVAAHGDCNQRIMTVV
jgi:hypothetical protein